MSLSNGIIIQYIYICIPARRIIWYNNAIHAYRRTVILFKNTIAYNIHTDLVYNAFLSM